jgi:hypothetical protein
VDVVSFASGNAKMLPVKLEGTSGVLPVRLSSVDAQVSVPVTFTGPVTLRDVAAKDGALSVRVVDGKK